MKLVAGRRTCGPRGSSTRGSRARRSPTWPRTSSTSCPGCCSREQPIDYRSEIRVLGATLADRPRPRAAAAAHRREAARPGPRRTDDGRPARLLRQRRGLVQRAGAARAPEALWNYEAPEGGGDTHVAIVRGSRSRVEVLQGAEQKWRPELYVVPNRPADARAVEAALVRRIAELAKARPGLTVEDEGARLPRGRPRPVPGRPRGALRRGDRALPRLPEGPRRPSRSGRRPTCSPSTG